MIFAIKVKKQDGVQEVNSTVISNYIANGWTILELEKYNDLFRKEIKTALQNAISDNSASSEKARKEYNFHKKMAIKTMKLNDEEAAEYLEFDKPDLCRIIRVSDSFNDHLEQYINVELTTEKEKRLQEYKKRKKEEAEFDKLEEEFLRNGDVASANIVKKSKPKKDEFNDGIDL